MVNDGCKLGITLGVTGTMINIPTTMSHTPVMASAPRIYWAMIVGLLHCLMNVIVFNDMTTPERVVYTDGGTWHVMNMIMADGILQSNCYENASSLFAIYTDVMHQIV